MTMSQLGIGLLIAGSLGLASVARADEKEERVTIDQVPAAAKATIERESKGATIKELNKETEGGKVVYGAEIVRDGKESEIHVAADGTVTKREAGEHEEDEE
jgi:uncharacterized membrane protein YkoI